MITQAIVKTQFAQFAGVFDLGDKVQIETKSYEQDTILFDAQRVLNRESGKWETVSDTDTQLLAHKGSYKGFRVKGKNGEYYDDKCFQGAIGYVPLSSIFKKLN